MERLPGRTLTRWALMLALASPSLVAFAQNTTDSSQNALNRPTYQDPVRAILANNCVECHRPHGIGPMSLIRYEEVRPWAKSIAKEVAARQMPPWDANPAVGRFSNDTSLDSWEIETLLTWIESGAPEGAPIADASPPEDRQGSWRLGEPDLVVELPAFEVPAEGEDMFPNVVFPLNTTERKSVTAIEVLPGDRRVLHHMLAFKEYLPMNQHIVDERTGPDHGKATLAAPEVLFVWAAGSPPIAFPEGIGRGMNAQQTITLGFHYHPFGEATKDITRLGFHFADQDLEKEMISAVAVNPTLNIPANSDSYSAQAYYLFSQDSRIHALFPHQHMRGKEIWMRLRTPDGVSQELLHVPNYDFNWQWMYYPENGIFAPEGSVIELEGRWDNTAANAANPDPTRSVRFGDQTDDEMLAAFIEFTVDEGARPAVVNPRRKLIEVLRRHPQDQSFVGAAGFLNFGVYAPDEGDGIFYFIIQEVMLSATLTDITREPGRLKANTNMLAGVGLLIPLGIEAQIDPDGSIHGTLEFDAPDDPRIPRMSLPPTPNFRGSRLDALQSDLASVDEKRDVSDESEGILTRRRMRKAAEQTLP